jgi:hypothetical protein
MGFLTKAAEQVRPARKVYCPFCIWLDTLDEEDQATVDRLLHSPDWTIEGLRKFFQENGSKAGVNTVSRHVKGECGS